MSNWYGLAGLAFVGLKDFVGFRPSLDFKGLLHFGLRDTMVGLHAICWTSVTSLDSPDLVGQSINQSQKIPKQKTQHPARELRYLYIHGVPKYLFDLCKYI